MLEILKSTKNIEDAFYIISRKLDIIHKLFCEARQTIHE
jgi:hypothetical protein